MTVVSMHARQMENLDLTYVRSRAPSGPQSVQVRTADSRVSDLDIDVGLFEWLAVLGELLPDHLAVRGLVAQAHPSFELVVFARHLWNCLVDWERAKELILDKKTGEGAKKKEKSLDNHDTYIYVCKHPCIRMERAQNPTLSPSSLETSQQER